LKRKLLGLGILLFCCGERNENKEVLFVWLGGGKRKKH
jgi:hypothetical protein